MSSSRLDLRGEAGLANPERQRGRPTPRRPSPLQPARSQPRSANPCPPLPLALLLARKRGDGLAVPVTCRTPQRVRGAPGPRNSPGRHSRGPWRHDRARGALGNHCAASTRPVHMVGMNNAGSPPTAIVQRPESATLPLQGQPSAPGGDGPAVLARSALFERKLYIHDCLECDSSAAERNRERGAACSLMCCCGVLRTDNNTTGTRSRFRDASASLFTILSNVSPVGASHLGLPCHALRWQPFRAATLL